MGGSPSVKYVFDVDVVLAKVSNVRKTVAAIRLVNGPDHERVDD